MKKNDETHEKKIESAVEDVKELNGESCLVDEIIDSITVEKGKQDTLSLSRAEISMKHSFHWLFLRLIS